MLGRKINSTNANGELICTECIFNANRFRIGFRMRRIQRIEYIYVICELWMQIKMHDKAGCGGGDGCDCHCISVNTDANDIHTQHNTESSGNIAMHSLRRICKKESTVLRLSSSCCEKPDAICISGRDIVLRKPEPSDVAACLKNWMSRQLNCWRDLCISNFGLFTCHAVSGCDIRSLVSEK